MTHTNALLAKNAVCSLFDGNKIPKDVFLLSCATSSPDQLLPSHASMVHGELQNHPMEIYSSSGGCLTSLQALKICYSNILSELHASVICVASEYISPIFRVEFYNPEYEETHGSTDKDPYMAFEKDFLRFMLSDGSGAVFLQDHPEGECPLKIEGIEMTSYFMGSELTSMEQTKSWKEFTPEEIKSRDVMLLKQDIRQLKKYSLSKYDHDKW